MKVISIEDRRSILIALVIGIFLICIQSLILRFTDFIFSLLISAGDTIANFTISLTAEGNPDRSTGLAIWLILMIAFFAFLTEVESVFGRLKSLRNRILDSLAELDEHDKKTDTDIEAERSESTVSKLERFRQSSKDRLKEISRLRWSATLLAIVSIAFLLSLYFYMTVLSIANTYNVKFRNNVTVLSVYLSDLEIKQLRANWVQMQTKKDYQEIKKQIDAYYKKFDIKK